MIEKIIAKIKTLPAEQQKKILNLNNCNSVENFAKKFLNTNKNSAMGMLNGTGIGEENKKFFSKKHDAYTKKMKKAS